MGDKVAATSDTNDSFRLFTPSPSTDDASIYINQHILGVRPHGSRKAKKRLAVKRRQRLDCYFMGQTLLSGEVLERREDWGSWLASEDARSASSHAMWV